MAALCLFKMSIQSKVEEFHRVYGVPIRKVPEDIPGSEAALRQALMEEELNELIEAMRTGDLVAIADGLADLLYVVYGTAVQYGIWLDPVVNAVHESNMSKLGEDGKPIVREDGKILKGPNFKEPNIAWIIGVQQS